MLLLPLEAEEEDQGRAAPLCDAWQQQPVTALLSTAPLAPALVRLWTTAGAELKLL
eukprot:COSAG02_NODE_35670_length_465_cov_0.808743_1_plen_55_part_10